MNPTTDMRMYLLFLLFFVCVNGFTQSSRCSYPFWDFKVNSPGKSLEMYVNRKKVFTSSEFGVFRDEKYVYAFEVYFRLRTSNDTLYLCCSDIYTECSLYEYVLEKSIPMRRSNVLNRAFRLTFVDGSFRYSIRVKPKHGNFIVFRNNPELEKPYCHKYLQKDVPFVGGGEPKRVEY